MQKKEALPPVGRWGERGKGILDVATLLYMRGGYEKVSMAAVASAAGLSEGTLYNYFRDKHDLVLRVGLAVLERHTAEAEALVAGAKSLREGLQGLIALELRALIEAKEIYRIWLREVRGANGYGVAAARDSLQRFSTQVIRLFKAWRATPDPRLGLDFALMRDMMFGGLERVVWTAVMGRREDDIDVPRLSRDLTAAYLRAFGLDPAAGRACMPSRVRSAGQSGARYKPKRQGKRRPRGAVCGARRVSGRKSEDHHKRPRELPERK
jgi:TetR/AcrR family transcriptional regulator, fatty acid metabolism regulator protein